MIFFWMTNVSFNSKSRQITDFQEWETRGMPQMRWKYVFNIYRPLFKHF